MSRHACLALLCTLLLGGSARTRAESPAPVGQRYQIDATLDDVRHTVHGTLRLSLTNTSSAALPALLFHLYLEAFRDKRSVFMRESGGSLRGTKAEGSGGIALATLRVDGRELLPQARRELIPGDFTQLSVPLPAPLAPGQTAKIEIAFTARLPRLFARSGYLADFHAVTQWFPKLAKLSPDGRFESFPYHGLGEFYADFADYDVTLRTPPQFQVGATGALVSDTTATKQRVRRYRAQRVHDMAWFAWPSFVLTKRRMGAVDVTFLAPPGYALAQLEHENIVRRGLGHYAARFGPYPYPTLTVVMPPRGADGAAGMEYPSLIVTAGAWLPTPFLPSLSGAVVSAHELGHQWFYGIVASNEVQYPVLDEGLTEWASLDLMRSVYGASDALLGRLALDRFEVGRVLVLQHLPSTRPGLAAHAYTALEYATSVYGRAALALESIRRAHGKRRFELALARYAREQRFRHPGPAELGAAFDATYGAGFARDVLFPLLLEGETSAVRIASAATRRTRTGYITSLHARRQGAVALPTWLCLYDANDRELTRAPWPASTDILRVSLETREPVARAVLDPERALLLDSDTRDQVWSFRAARGRHLLSQLVAAAQALFAWVGP